MNRPQENARLSSVLGESAVVIGNVSGHGDLEIRGKVQGDVVLEGRAFVAAGGIVLGRVEALTVIVAGQVRGDLVAGEGVEIEATGDVEGNISAPRVAIHGGARVRGSLHAGDTSEVAEFVAPPAPQKRATVEMAPSASETVSSPSDARAEARNVERPPTPSLRRGLPLPAAKKTVEPKAVEPKAAAPQGGPPAPARPKKGGPPPIPTFRSGARAALKDAE